MANQERADLVLALVRGLVAEVHPHAPRLTVTLDSRFDDLGIGSLELSELLLRVGEACGVALPPHILACAETPGDLLQAVQHSHAPMSQEVGVVSPPATVAGGAAPPAASTLIDALEWHVSVAPQQTHIRILDESGSADDVTYEALHREAAAVAAGLLARDIMPGHTVAIMLPTSRAYFVTFAGVLLAGAVPVPLYPPARRSQRIY
jgi:acyl carrier protein